MATDPRADGGARGDVPPAGPADDRLVQRARAGDLEAFDALVERHVRGAFAVARRVMGQREDAEDLVQEAFVIALRRLDSFETGRPFAPWLHRIVVNRGLNLRKARALRSTEPIPEDTAGTEESPARHAERRELRDRLHAALAALPEQERLIVELFDLEGFNSAEIAEMLEIPRGTVRWHLHQARHALRRELAPFGGRDA